MPPLPNADDVRQLKKRLESVEARRQETNEKRDKVLAALSAKSQDKVLGFAASLLGCSTTPSPSLQQAWDEAAVECDDTEEDRCVTLLCLGDACGF